MLSSDLKEAFSQENIEQAWLWTRTNSNREYKQYFRHIYRAYAITIPRSLQYLRNRLNKETFTPSYATKFYFPKKSGILRPYSLLCVEDQIVYQALVNIVANKLVRQVGSRYQKSIFGNLYAGKKSLYFYQDWRKGYGAFSEVIRDTVDRGFIYSASFDLTACYDSIDHKVLCHFLEKLGLQKEFCKFLCDCLLHWTVAQNERPIFIGHGIPQGPLPSGLLSEVVLRHFDEDKRNPRQITYFRYVDDIRLFSKSESSLRSELVKLDKSSKEIGLFPQSGKIEIHKVKNIDEEIKSISHPPEWEAMSFDPNQKSIRDRLVKLTPRYKVSNETRFKYVLGRAAPKAELAERLLKVVEKQPHLYRSIFGHLTRAPKLSSKVSSLCIKLLKTNDLYASFSASLIRSVRDNLNKKQLPNLYNYCRSRLNGRFLTSDPELRAVVVGVLLKNGKLTWAQAKYNVSWSQSWWVRSAIIGDINISLIGIPSYQNLIDLLMRDRSPDVSVVAVEHLLSAALHPAGNLGEINIIGQYGLRNAGETGRVVEGVCILSRFIISTLGNRTAGIRWKNICGNKYTDILGKIVRWAAYAQTDATAWVNLTDTINDLILDRLFQHDSTIGNRILGNFGSVMQAGSRFAHKYPLLYNAVITIHKRRLESDLSHAITRGSGRITRPIRFKEIPRLKTLLSSGYNELWRKW